MSHSLRKRSSFPLRDMMGRMWGLVKGPDHRLAPTLKTFLCSLEQEKVCTLHRTFEVSISSGLSGDRFLTLKPLSQTCARPLNITGHFPNGIFVSILEFSRPKVWTPDLTNPGSAGVGARCANKAQASRRAWRARCSRPSKRRARLFVTRALLGAVVNQTSTTKLPRPQTRQKKGNQTLKRPFLRETL